MAQEELSAGFVTASAGNHGQAVAWCAKKLGAPCTVYVPDDAVSKGTVDGVDGRSGRKTAAS